MAEVKQKTSTIMKQAATCPNHARTDVVSGNHEMTIDEPEPRGGTDLGPPPTEVLMASLIGCTNVIAHRIAEKNGVHFQSMSIDLEATFDRRGVMLAEEVDVPFPNVTLTLNVTTDADDTALQKVKDDLPRFCPVSKVIRGSGTVITEVWNVTRP